jgi:uncharacterized membrane protein
MATPKTVLWLRRRFITGFFVAVPLIISVAALVWSFHFIDDLSGPVYDRFLGRHLPGLGAATTVLMVLLVGVVASNVLGKRLLSAGEAYLARIPVFGTIYSPVKQMLAAFSPDNELGLKRVVMITDPAGVARLGFLTKEFELVPPGGGPSERWAAVYVPTNHLYLGDVFVCRREALGYPEIAVQDGVRLFLTGGMAMANRIAALPPASTRPDHLSS